MNFQPESVSGESDAPFNLTPLIDVLFLLVIFFAVSTSFREQPGVSVRLPEAGADRFMEEKGTVVAIVTSTGQIRLDGEPVAIEDVEHFLEQRQKEFPVALFVLQADEMARHGRVVAVMDAAQRAGVARFAIATRPEEEAGPRPGDFEAPFQPGPGGK